MFKKQIRDNAVLLLFLLSSAMVLVLSVSTRGMMAQSAAMIEETSQHKLKAVAQSASLLVTGEELDAFLTAKDMENPAYSALKEKLAAFNDAAGLTFTYYVRKIDADNAVYVIDNVPLSSEDASGLGDEPFSLEEGIVAALSGEIYAVPLGSYTEGYEGLLTAWAPVYYSDGTLSNMAAGVDMQDMFIWQAQQNSDSMSTLLILAILVVAISGGASLLLYRRKAQQSNAASQAKGSFLSRMSHEMRTPLNAIIGLCDMAEHEKDPQKVAAHFESIRVSSKHLRSVIDNVLDLSKIESGKVVLELIPTDLHRELFELRHIIQPQADLKSQRFVLDIAPDVPHFVHCDSTHMRQILVNLLSNAMKFTPESGMITLTVEALSREANRTTLQFSVRDTGIGIDAETQKRLFTPFEQGDISTTRRFGGTGLGLSITRQLIELMQGTIRIESIPGEGSTFIINLTLENASEEEISEVIEQGDFSLDLTGMNILLVEDSEINRMIAINLFEMQGATVESACDGQEGYEAFLRNPDKYTLIFMDIQMPNMDGYTCAQCIRSSGLAGAKDIPIIAMTANVFAEDVEKAFAAGMNGHVRKPFEPQKIFRAIEKVLMK